MPELRPYQSAAVDRVRAAIRAGKRRVLLMAPTGAGKTVIATEGIIKPGLRMGTRFLFIAHRTELIDQCAAKLPWHATSKIVAGVYHPMTQPVQVASIQTLVRRRLPTADVVVWDECHHATAETYRRIAAQYPDAVHIGLSATPYRADGSGLGAAFDHLEVVATTADLINLGFLVPAKTFAPPAPDLTGVHTTAGDYNQGELAVAVDKPKLVGDIAATYRRLAAGRRAICFAVSVEHSQHLALAFAQGGINAAHLDGTTPADKRREMIYRLGHGSLDVICNVGVLTEGTDIPQVSCIILARPTKSRGLWKQMVGRGLRVADGKRDCIVLDHAGCFHRHGLVTDEEDLSLAGVKRRPDQGMPVRQCLQCYAVVPSGLAQCDQCGEAFPPAPKAELAHEAGELVEAVATPQRPVSFHGEQAEFLDQLLAKAVTLKYKAGWVGYKFKERFNRWPCGVAQLQQRMDEAARRMEGGAA